MYYAFCESGGLFITRLKDVLHFYKWWVQTLAIGVGHISPASLKRSGRFFEKAQKTLIEILL
jgi:hypothetical protein